MMKYGEIEPGGKAWVLPFKVVHVMVTCPANESGQPLTEEERGSLADQVWDTLANSETLYNYYGPSEYSTWQVIVEIANP